MLVKQDPDINRTYNPKLYGKSYYWDTRGDDLTSTWAQFKPRGCGRKKGVVKFQAVAGLTRPKFSLIVEYHSDHTWVLLRMMLRLSTSGNLVRAAIWCYRFGWFH